MNAAPLQRRRFIFAALAPLLVSACASAGGSTASQYGLASDYEVGAVYELRHDRFIDQPSALSGSARLRRPAEGEYLQSVWSRTPIPAPASIEDYDNNRSRWPSIRGVLRQGARVRISAIEYHEPFITLDAWLDVYAEVLEGPFRGQRVDLLLISRRRREGDASVGRVVDVDPDELLRVER